MSFAAQLVVETDPGREAPRRVIDADATLRDAAARPCDVTVADISTTGFAIRSAVPLAVGATVQLGLAGVTVEKATVVRREGAFYGCRFLRPITAEQVRAAGAVSTVHAGAFAGWTSPASASQTELTLRARAGIILSISLALWLVLLGVADLAYRAATLA